MSIVRALLAFLLLGLPSAYAACPEINTYPFQDGCSLKAEGLNSAIGSALAAGQAAEAVASAAAASATISSAEAAASAAAASAAVTDKMNKTATDAVLPTALNNLLAQPAGVPLTAPSLKISGATSGTLTLGVPSVVGTNTITLPAGTTDFSTTGGTNQVVRQNIAGGAFTVTQLSAANLSNGTTGTGGVVLQTDAGLITPNLGTPSAGVLTNATGLPLTTGVTGILAGANGGTGVNNSGKTITLGGNLVTSGAFAATLTLTGTTDVTLPTTGTLATTAGTMPHVATNVVLAAATTSLYPSGVWRDDYAAGNGAPPLFFIPLVGTCAANSLVNDGGACVNSSGGNSWKAVYNGPADFRQWGAKFDGVTDDSVTLAAALASGIKSFICPAAKVAIAANLVAGNQINIDCQMAKLQAPAGSAGKWIIKRTGAYNNLSRIWLDDTSSHTLVSTTLGAVTAAGATNLEVASSANMAVGMPIAITLDSGIQWVSKITAVPDATHVTILDAIPNSATAIVVNAGGSGYVANDALVSLGGTGLNAPLTIKAAVTAGAVTGGTIEAPGLFTNVPANPVSTSDTTSIRASGATFDVTWAGAASGNAVKAAWGLLMSSGAVEGTVSDLRISAAPVGIVYNTTGSPADGDQLQNFQLNNITLVGLFKDVDVHDTRFRDGTIWGTVGSCAAGVYINGASSTQTGGNRFSGVYEIQCGIGWLLQSVQLDEYSQLTADTNKYYNIGLGALQAGRNATDLNIDSTSTLSLAGMIGNAGPGRAITGDGAGIQSGVQTISTQGLAVGGAGSTIYFGLGQSSTEANVLWRNALYNSSVVRVQIATPSAPGAGESYTATLRVGSADTPMTCSFSGAASFGCNITSPILMVQPINTMTVKIVSSAGAIANNFNVTVKQQ